MKKYIITLILTGVFAIPSMVQANNGEEKYKTIEIGTAIPAATVKMKDISGKMISLKEQVKSNGLLVMFSSNTCPFVVMWEDRYDDVRDFCAKNNIGFVLVNSNEMKRTGDDSFDEMKKHASEKKYNCMYALDQNSEVANAFGAKTTPHVFLFDKTQKLVYKGAIDDNYKDPSSVKVNYIENAVNSMLQGKKISPNSTTPVGCSVKRKLDS